jgi:succinyl-CoA synthetase beta subunit
VNIHEFEAKEIFAARGIPVPKGQVADTPEAAVAAAKLLSTAKVVVKSQIHAGGRGKGAIVDSSPAVHGVAVVSSPEAAGAHAAKLLGRALRTHQTLPQGQVVKRVLVEEASDIAKELYAGIVLDRDTSRVAFIVSTEGGMDIEEVADKTPDRIFRQGIDVVTGFQPYHGRKLADALQLKGNTAKQAASLFAKLYAMYVETDASMVEINPLVITGKGDVIALDGKVNFDDNAMFRQKAIASLRDLDEEDPKERDAHDAGLQYVALEGNIGCLVNGAGLAMATMDIIKYCGGQPANFLDVGGGATAEQVTQAFKIILADHNVKAILVNIFGGIAKCDVIASGIITAAKEVGLHLPLVVRLEGTNVEQGKKLLAESGLAIEPANDMLDAAKKAVAAAAKGGAR